MWFQLLFLFGFLAVEFKGTLDEILYKISDASLRYFGADLEFPFLSENVINQIKNGYYVGKYTGKGETPYVFQKMLIPTVAYMLMWIVSAFPLGSSKDIIVAIRSGIGFSYGVQFAFMCAVNFVAFFGAGAYNGYTILGTLVALVLLILLWVEVIMMKRYVNSGAQNFMTVEKSKGISTYDIIGESNDKRIRDYKNWYINEVDCLLLAAMIIGFLGRAFLTQTILLILVGILMILSIVMIKQQFRGPKIALAVLLFLLGIVTVIFHATGREASVSTVNGMTIFFMIVFFLALLVNLIIFILRLLNLLVADFEVKRSYVSEEPYIEKTPRKPQNEMVTYQKEEEVTKVSKMSPRAAAGITSAYQQVAFNREVNDRSAYNRSAAGQSGFVPYKESSEKKALADDSSSQINQSRFR